MNEMYYEIDEKARKVRRIRGNGYIHGQMSFDDILTLQAINKKKPIGTDDIFFIYLIAYDELVDRGLIKENE